MAATLHLVREICCDGASRGTFHVLLYGNDVGSTDMHGTIETPIEPDHTKVKAWPLHQPPAPL